LRDEALVPGVIDAAVAGRAAEPVEHVLRRFQRRKMFMKLEEYLLRHFLGQRAIVEKMIRNTEHHSLVLVDGLREVRCLHHSQDIYEA
jgi:hypothetical protein